MEENKIRETSVEELNNYSDSALIILPSFSDGQNLIVRLKRPSLLELAKNGEIPNQLLGIASSLFTKGVNTVSENGGEQLKEMFSICEAVAKASMVAPTYAEVINAGLKLTDEQLMAIFNYSQRGVRAIIPFDKKQDTAKNTGNVGRKRLFGK